MLRHRDDACSLSLPSLAVLSKRMRLVQGTYSEALRTTRDFIRFLQTLPQLTEWEKSMIRVSTVNHRMQSAVGLRTIKIDTSISFGAAIDFLGIHRAHTHVLILYCGTGTVQFQLYGRHEGQIHPMYAYTPRDPEAAPTTSLSSLPIGAFHPVVVAGHPADFRAQVIVWLTGFVAFLASTGLHNVPVAALVTGGIRAWWEANQGTCSAMEDGVAEILQDICPSIVAATGISFFLPQAMEGIHAHTALATLIEADSGAQAPRKVLLGVCIEQGNTQISFLSASSMVGVTSVPMAAPAMGAFVWHIRKALDDGMIPVIFLRAGALLAYTDVNRINEGLGVVVDAILRDVIAMAPTARRSVATTGRQVPLWDVELKNGTTDAASRQDMMTAIWTAAPDRIHLLK